MTEDTRINIAISLVLMIILLVGIVIGVNRGDGDAKTKISEIVMETKGQEIVGVSEVGGSTYITTRGINCEKFVESDLSASSSINMWSETEYKLCTNSREEIRMIK